MEMLRRPRQPHGRYLFLARMVRVSHETIHLSLFVDSRCVVSCSGGTLQALAEALR
jgi:hypothetical protein